MNMQVRLNAFAAFLSFGFVIAVVLGILCDGRPGGTPEKVIPHQTLQGANETGNFFLVNLARAKRQWARYLIGPAPFLMLVSEPTRLQSPFA